MSSINPKPRITLPLVEAAGAVSGAGIGGAASPLFRDAARIDSTARYSRNNPPPTRSAVSIQGFRAASMATPNTAPKPHTVSPMAMPSATLRAAGRPFCMAVPSSTAKFGPGLTSASVKAAQNAASREAATMTKNS